MLLLEAGLPGIPWGGLTGVEEETGTGAGIFGVRIGAGAVGVEADIDLASGLALEIGRSVANLVEDRLKVEDLLAAEEASKAAELD